MPINPNIPEAFIAAYSHIHHPQHTQSFAESLTSTAYGLVGKITPEQKTQSCKDIINRFKPNLTAHEWIELTYALGESAREHQLDKIKPLQKTIDPSHFSKAIHAARSYIVACLSSDAAYQTTYQTTLAELNAALCEQDKRIAENRRLIKVDVSTLCKHRNLLLVKLAYLGDEAALDRCIDYGLFDYMPRLNHHRMNQPICMEKNYFVTYYEKELHAELNKNLQSTIRNLQDFIDGAINRTLLFKLTLHNEEKIQSKLNLGLVPVIEAPKAEPQVEGAAPKPKTAEKDQNDSSTEELENDSSPAPSPPPTPRVVSPVNLFPPKPPTPPLEGGVETENKMGKN